MIIDKKGKVFGKISIIDILIIAIIVFAGVLFLYYQTANKPIPPPPVGQVGNIRITFISLSRPDELAYKIKKGDDVKAMNTEKVYGKVIDVILTDSPYYGYDLDGKVVLSAKPGFKTVTIVVEGRGRYSDSKVFFNNVEYFKNKQLAIVAGRVALWVSVSDITKL